MKKLSILDLAFLLAETQDSPKHVAGLLLCKKPKNAPRNFGRQLFNELLTYTRPTEPFNLVINFLGLTGPRWDPCKNFSIDDHLFYHRSKRVISWMQVQEMVARMHESVLDRSKPLWEFHLIDGVKGGKFAIYVKIHHAYADGMTMTSWLEKSLETSPENMPLTPLWTMKKPQKAKKKRASASLLSRTIRSMKAQTWDQVLATGGIAKLSAQQYLERLGLTKNAVSLQFNAKKNTPLTGRVSPGRLLATATLSMQEIKTVSKATQSTLNHVALTCIDGAMHRYLKDVGSAIDHPISIQMPVSLRKEGEKNSGNSVGIVLVDLAMPTDDPLKRLREIAFGLRNLRKHIDSVAGTAMQQYTVLTAATGELIEKLHLSDYLPSNGHTLVSNVPGPRESRYLKGAKVEQMYPVSTLLPGLLTNITLFSFGTNLNVGIVAARDLQELPKLATYIEEEFEELKQAVKSAV